MEPCCKVGFGNPGWAWQGQRGDNLSPAEVPAESALGCVLPGGVGWPGVWWLLHTQVTMLVWVLGSGRELRGSSWRLQKKHPTWASQSKGFMDDAKSPKLTVSARVFWAVLLQAWSRSLTWRGQECGPHRKKEALQIRLSPLQAPVPHPHTPHQATFQPHRLTASAERPSLG